MTEPGSDLWTRGTPRPGEAGRHGAATRVLPGVAATPVFPGDGARLGGASRAPGRVPYAVRTRRRRWPWAALAAVGVAALLLGLVRCGAERGATDAPTAPSWATATPAGAPPGSLSVGVRSVFAAAAAGGTGLAAITGQTASGRAVPVQSVPADEGFWIGTGPADRVWVQLTTNSESAVTITAGQLLDLAGPIVPHGADFAGKAGVSAADGAEQLTLQGAHLEVAPSKIAVVGPPEQVRTPNGS